MWRRRAIGGLGLRIRAVVKKRLAWAWLGLRVTVLRTGRALDKLESWAAWPVPRGFGKGCRSHPDRLESGPKCRKDLPAGQLGAGSDKMNGPGVAGGMTGTSGGGRGRVQR